MIIRYFLTFVLFLSFYSLTLSQNPFERSYISEDDNVYPIDFIAAENGGYYMMYLINGMEAERDTFLGVSSLDEKGSENWSRQYTISDTISISMLGGQIREKENGNLILYLNLDTLNNAAMYAELTSTGLVEDAWINNSERESDFESVLNISGDDTYILNNVDTNTSASFNIISRTGSLTNWAKNFSRPDTFLIADSERVVDLKESIDGNHLVLGESRLSPFLEGKNGGFLMKMDTDGVIIWSRSFTSLNDELVSFNVKRVEELSDSSLIVVGYETSGIVPLTSGFAMLFTKDGEFIWRRNFNVKTGLFNTVVEDMVLSEDKSQIVVSGYSQEDAPLLLRTPYLLSMNLDGSINWTQEYTQSLDFDFALQKLVNVEGGFYGIGGIMRESVLDPNYGLKIISTDDEGATLCHVPNMDATSFADTLMTDTMLFEVNNIAFTLDSLDLEVGIYSGFNLTTLTLENFNFCPDEPIIATIDATTEGASMYAWSTGESTPTITVNEEGVYMVTVTINEEICYSLCDSSVVAVYDLPTVNILQDITNFCADGSVRLIAQAQAEAGVQSISWSTGSSDPFIDVNDNQSYTVTVVDNCGETASATATANFPVLIESVTIGIDTTGFCEMDSLILFATATPGEATGYTWSNGTSGQSTLDIAPGTFSVTVTDFCLDQYTAELEVTKADLPNCNENCLLFPNVIVPNSEEELNKSFRPIEVCNPNPDAYSLSVFNRWGQKVFETSEIEDGWNGIYNEQPQPGAVYVYYAKYTVDGIEQEAKGDFTLLR